MHELKYACREYMCFVFAWTMQEVEKPQKRILDERRLRHGTNTAGLVAMITFTY